MIARWSRRLALVVLGVGLGLVVGEWLVRAVRPQSLVTENLRYVADPDTGFRLQPSQLVPGRIGGPVNAHGLRGPEVPGGDADEFRLLVLGDSFTFGAGVHADEAFPARLEDALAERCREATGETLRALNAGTPSYGTARELAWLRSRAGRLDPDAVLLAFFVGNDLTDNMSPTPSVFDRRLVGAEFAGEATWELRLRLWRAESHLWRLFARSRAERPPEPAPRPPADPNRPAPPREEVERRLEEMRLGFAAGQAARLAIYAPESDQPPRVAEAYARTEPALDGIDAWCRERGLPLAVVVLPDVMQVEPDLFDHALEVSGIPNDWGDRTRPQAFVAAWAAAHDVPCLDLLPAFRERWEATGESLYLFSDSHFAVEGHALAAEKIAAGLAFW